MKLTLKITERDKKLLVFLVVFVLVVGVGIGIILPLLQKGQKLQMQIVDVSIEQQQKQSKQALLPADESTRRVLTVGVESQQAALFPMMDAAQIDRMFTEQATEQDLVVQDFSIAMPTAEEYTEITPYEQILAGKTAKEQEKESCYGVYTVKLELTLSGKRDNLQKYLDSCFAQEPKLRFTEFLWQDQAGNEGEQTSRLYISIELYMAEPVAQNPYLTDME